MAALTTACPAPFLAESAYPYTAGLRSGRFCGPVAAGLSCCLPCPLEHLVYSDAFARNKNIAYWFNVPALVCQAFLLLSYAVLKERHSHAHYLSIGLCISLAALELSFIIPLGAKPKMCHDPVTPNDLHSDMTCAWSGALLEAGAMAGAIWILLRSLWTYLRVCADVRHTQSLFWVAQALGWGLPAIFLAISLPITGVSYQTGTTCFPNQHSAFVTWFGWLLAFACLAALIQFITTGFCLWLYLRHFWTNSSSGASADSSEMTSNVAALMPDAEQKPRRASVWLGKKLAWRRVRKVLYMQWRSIVLSLFVVTEIIYFGVVFVAETRAARAASSPAKTAKIEAWAACLVLSGGNKNECLQYAGALGLSENVILATFFMAALIGLFTFGLMVQWSMLEGWWELIRSPQKYRRKSGPELFVLVTPKDKQAGKGSVVRPNSMTQTRDMSGLSGFPEAGDVSARHETTDWFDDGDGFEEMVEDGRPKRSRVREDLEDI